MVAQSAHCSRLSSSRAGRLDLRLSGRVNAPPCPTRWRIWRHRREGGRQELASVGHRETPSAGRDRLPPCGPAMAGLRWIELEQLGAHTKEIAAKRVQLWGHRGPHVKTQGGVVAGWPAAGSAEASRIGVRGAGLAHAGGGGADDGPAGGEGGVRRREDVGLRRPANRY